MDFFVLIIGSIFTVFATAILSYISMATMVGPWIAPIIVLMSSAILRLQKKHLLQSQKHTKMALIQTIGSVGGIISIGVGFSLPTLYFLNPTLFTQWLKYPLNFCATLTLICIISGSLGMLLARNFAEKLIIKEKLSFPVSHLIYNTITSQTQQAQAKNMFFGVIGSWIICFLRDGLFKFQGIISKVYYLFPSILGKEAPFSIFPMLWAIGFIVGIKIAFPLLIGMISKYIVVYPLNNHSLWLPIKLFSPLTTNDFITAFCSGLVLSELILGLLKYPKVIFCKIKNTFSFNITNKILDSKNKFLNHLKNKKKSKTSWSFINHILPTIIIIASAIFLSYLSFNLAAIVFLLIFTVIFTYQLSYLSGKIGLVTFGRFATFIMIPMMLLFKLDAIQITFLCVFFNICAACATDLLFDYKVGELCNIDFKKIYKYQWLGLIVTSVSIGFFLWLLFTNFEIGSPDLFAQRGKSRALLIQSLSFNWIIVFFGFLYGVILKKLKVSPTMVFGGLLMNNQLTIGLVIGSLISWFSKNNPWPKLSFLKREVQEPIWSGIFAGESLWILFAILLKMIG